MGETPFGRKHILQTDGTLPVRDGIGVPFLSTFMGLRTVRGRQGR